MFHTRLPLERVGVLVGPEGRTKSRLQELSGVRIVIDSATGEVLLDESKAKEPAMALKVRDVVTAIARGFAEERASRLLEDDVYLRVIEIREFATSRNRVKELAGRVIGARGRTRQIIEELSGADVSVYGHTVSIVGDALQLDIASRAVEMVLGGSEHASVYRFLERKRAELRMAEMGF